MLVVAAAASVLMSVWAPLSPQVLALVDLLQVELLQAQVHNVSMLFHMQKKFILLNNIKAQIAKTISY